MSKQFVLSDSSVNSYGFSIDLAKLDLERFKKNPVLLYNHNQLVGKWEDLKIEDGKFIGTPVFMDDEDEKESLKIKKRVESGFLKGASLGINILSVEHKTGEAPVVEAEVYECSIVDIPSNKNAVVLFDKNHQKLEGKELKLALDSIEKKHKKEDKMKLSALTITALALVPNFTEADVDTAVAKLSADKEDLQKQLNDIQKEKVENLVSTALSCGQITADQKEKFEKLALQDFDLAKETIGSLPKKKKLSGQEETSEEETEDRSAWTFKEWREKDTAGLLKIKATEPTEYAKIIKKN